MTDNFTQSTLHMVMEHPGHSTYVENSGLIIEGECVVIEPEQEVLAVETMQSPYFIGYDCLVFDTALSGGGTGAPGRPGATGSQGIRGARGFTGPVGPAGPGNPDGIGEAPIDNSPYMRKGGLWIPFNYTNFPPPQDSFLYGKMAEFDNFKLDALGLGGDPGARFVSLNELTDIGVIVPKPGGGYTPIGPHYQEIPPAPAGFRVLPMLEHIQLFWSNPLTQYTNHSHTVVYRATSPDFASSVIIATVPTVDGYVDSGAVRNTTYFYWIRYVASSGQQGPLSYSAGIEGKLANSVEALVEVLEGEIRASMLHQSLKEPIEWLTEPGGAADSITQTQNDLLNEVSLRAEAILSESYARQQGLLMEAEARGTDIANIQTIMASDKENLVQEIMLLTSTSNAVFDSTEIWQFDVDSDAEGWIDGNNAVPVVFAGYLKPAFSNNTYLIRTGLEVSGELYTQVRVRVRKVGDPSWVGRLYFTTPSSPAIDLDLFIEIDEPAYINHEATGVWDLSNVSTWTNEIITGIQLQLTSDTNIANYFEYDWISVGRPGPGASLAAILEERAARTSADEAEATARLLLATQVADNKAAVDNQILVLTDADSALAQQIQSLTAGTDTQFDHATIWYFDTGIEGWAGQGTSPVTTNPGWLRPNDAATGPLLASPAGLAIDGTKYTQVRLRIKKTGVPVWSGRLDWTTTASPSFDTTKRLFIDEPTYATDGTANITFNLSGVNWVDKTITQIRLQLPTTHSTTNYFEIDWVAIGRPSPGASSAELLLEQQVRAAADAVNASNIVIANAAIASKASQTSVNALDSRVTTLDGTVTAQGTAITSLRSQLEPNAINSNVAFSDWTGAAPANWSTWSNAGVKYTGPLAYTPPFAIQYIVTSATTNTGLLQSVSNISESPYLDVELVFTLVSGVLNGAGILIDWRHTDGSNHRAVYRLQTEFTVVSVLGKKTVARARLQKPATFGTFASYQIYLMGNFDSASLGGGGVKNIIYDRCTVFNSDASAQAISTMDSRVTNAEGVNTAQAGQITALNSTVMGKADASAVTALTTRVSNTETVNTAQSTQLTTLTASVPGGGNLIPTDSEFSTDMAGWTLVGNTTGVTVTASRDLAGASWIPSGAHQIGLTHSGTVAAGLRAQLMSSSITVVEGMRYCFSAYIATHRGSVQLRINWYSPAGTLISEGGGTIYTPSTAGNKLSDWNNAALFMTAPTGATTCRVSVRYISTVGSGPFIWLCRPSLTQVPATTTVAPLYAPSGNSQTAAAIQVVAEAAASTANGAVARWEVKGTVGALTGGVGFWNDGNKVRFMIHADQFAVWAPGKNMFSLIIDGNDIVVPGGSLQARSIKTDRIEVGAVTSSSMFASTNFHTLAGGETNSTFGINLGNFVSTGVKVKCLVNGRVSIGSGYSPPVGGSIEHLHPDTAYVVVSMSLIVGGTPIKGVIMRYSPTYLINGNRSMHVHLDIVHQQVLAAGTRSVRVEFNIGYFNANGTFRSQPGELYPYTEVDCLMEENKV